MNPLATFRDPITVDDVLSSRWIAEPLHKLDCCIRTDGGGAVILTTEERARSLRRRPVSVLGVGIVLYVLARWREGRGGAVWILPPVFLLWANIDTFFVAGILIVAVTLLDLGSDLVEGGVVRVALLDVLRHGEAVLDVDRIADVAGVLQLEDGGL